MCLCAFPDLNLDSYHGTHKAANSSVLLGGSLSALTSIFRPGTPLQLCRELRQVFRSQTLGSRLSPSAKPFPPPAISRCGPAGCDRFPIQLPLPASWLALESACPLSRPRGRHPLRCDPPTSEN